jgi:ribose-phosphate pyrophosphokinase
MENTGLSKTVIFALSASQPLAKEICELLGIPLADCNVLHFADGEILVELGESVRGKDVYFIQSTNKPVNEHLMELLIGIDACKRASAATINCIIPYFGYARQDRKAKPRQPITSKLVASMLEAAGADRVVTMDLHATQIQGYFDIPADDITTLSLVANYFKNKEDINTDDIVVVSPDHGGTVRARKLADQLGVPVAIIDKRRPKPNVAVAMNLLGDVSGKTAVIIDDMVDTAGTLTSGVNMLYEKGAKAVYAACAHGILSGPAIERLQNSRLKEFICTNTIDQTSNLEKFPDLKVISVAPLLAATIKAIENNESLSATLNSALEHKQA